MEKLLKAAREGDIDELKRIINSQENEEEEEDDNKIRDFVNSQKPVTNITAMHLAAKGGYYDICELLFQYGAELDLTNTDERTPLHFAAMKGFYEICQFFVDNGAILDPRDVLFFIYRIFLYFLISFHFIIYGISFIY